LKRQLSVPEIRKGLSEKAVRSGGAYLQGDMGRRDKPLYRQDLAKIGRGQLPFQGLTAPRRECQNAPGFTVSATPAGSVVILSVSGGVASLNHRLLSGSPSGCTIITNSTHQKHRENERVESFRNHLPARLFPRPAIRLQNLREIRMFDNGVPRHYPAHQFADLRKADPPRYK